MGVWATPHPDEAGGKKRIWYVGSESEVWSLDGGDGTDPTSNPPTATTGAMWEVDHLWDFRFPLAAGTSPAPYSTTVSPGDTLGAEKVILALDEMPSHSHNAFVASSNGTSANVLKGLQTTDETEDGGAVAPAYLASSGGDRFIDLAGGDVNDATVGHNNMPPARVAYWIKRTARVYQTA